MRIFTVVIAVLTIAILSGGTHAAENEIRVDPSATHQTIEGFGTCLVSWVDRFQKLYRTEEFQRMYVEEYGFNFLRCNIWGPVSTEPVEDWREIRWQDFDMSIDRSKIFTDFGRGIRQINPDVKIIGTVWTPPPWMKMNKSWNDKGSGGIRAHTYRDVNNRVEPRYYMHFARWLVEMAKMYEAQGAPLYAISPGNEVQFTQSFGSCVWSGEDYAKIVELLGEMLEREGMGDIKIYGPETMTSHFYTGGTPAYVEAIMSHEGARKHFDVFATHGYEDGFKGEMKASSSRRFWNLVEDYGLPYWMTEGGTGGHEWPEPLHQGVAAAVHNSLVAGYASAFVPWQVIGGTRNHHCPPPPAAPHPAFTAKTYAAMHYSRFIGPGAVRINAQPAYGDVMASAYLHGENGELTVVLINPTDAQQDVKLSFADGPEAGAFQVYRTSADERLAELDPVPVTEGRLKLTMPAESMVTLQAR
jgi:O-glycosyl hydrolase